MGGDGATRLRSQSRRLARLAATRVVLVGDDEALLEAAAWLEILGKSLDDGGGVPAEVPARQGRSPARAQRLLQQAQRAPLRLGE